MVIKSQGFGFEIEVTAKVAKLGCRVYEVPTSCHGRTSEEGKKVSFCDGLAVIYYIVRYNLFYPRQQSFSQQPQL